ncbi:MAG: HEAT repeat domain-containing protein [Gemmataceae bacterium]|nr:HEAT repeat domain-containing protein [Gemmataceae bacterium]
MRMLRPTALALAILFPSWAAAGPMEDLVAKLKDKDSVVRRQAALELGEMGKDAGKAGPALMRALKDSDAFVRRYAAQALGKIGLEGKPAKEAISGIHLLTNDERKEVQLAAIETLSSFGEPALPALTSTLKDGNKDPQVRKKAAQGIGKIGLPARSAMGTLTEIVTGKGPKGKKGKMGGDDDLRPEAATALGKIAKKEDSDAVAALKSAAEAKGRGPLKQAAAEAYYKITGERIGKKKK